MVLRFMKKFMVCFNLFFILNEFCTARCKRFVFLLKTNWTRIWTSRAHILDIMASRSCLGNVGKHATSHATCPFQPRPQSSQASWDVTSSVKLVGRVRFQAISTHSHSANCPGDEAVSLFVSAPKWQLRWEFSLTRVTTDNSLTKLSDIPYSVYEFPLVRELIELDIKISICAIGYNCHLHSVRTKVSEAVCQSCDEIFLLHEITVFDAAWFVH